MWKGYNIRRGDKSEAFKKYLRTRNFYFEPSEDGNFIHFEVENPDEYVDGYIENMEKVGKDSTQYVYEFPDGTTLKDINLARRLGLTYLGKGKYRSGVYGYFIQGTLPELQFFADEYLGSYELHPDYLWPADEFAGIEELKSGGYFEDSKYCGKDKQVRLQGSKFKDGTENSTVIKMAQQEIDRLIEEELEPLYITETEDGDLQEISDWYTPEGQKKQEEIDEKITALCYVIKAYGGTPVISAGWDGLAEKYDGPRKS